jgi:hypothetical protein
LVNDDVLTTFVFTAMAPDRVKFPPKGPERTAEIDRLRKCFAAHKTSK